MASNQPSTEITATDSEDPMLNTLKNMLEQHKQDITDSVKETINDAVSTFQKKIANCNKKTRSLKKNMSEMASTVDSHTDELTMLTRENERLKAEAVSNKKQLRDLENYSRKSNLIIEGITESDNEYYSTLKEKVWKVH